MAFSVCLVEDESSVMLLNLGICPHMRTSRLSSSFRAARNLFRRVYSSGWYTIQAVNLVNSTVALPCLAMSNCIDAPRCINECRNLFCNPTSVDSKVHSEVDLA